MENYGFYSYLIGALAYAGLLLWSVPKIKRHSPINFFVIAVLSSLLWSVMTAYVVYSQNYFIADSLAYETLRNISWFLLLGSFISRQADNSVLAWLRASSTAQVLVVVAMLVFVLEAFGGLLERINLAFALSGQLRLTVHLLFAVVGLVLVEQVFRNAQADRRWAVKFLCIGLGGLFILDFILYSKSLLFVTIDPIVWESRGVLNALVVPLLMIAAQRIQTNSTAGITVSRQVVFYSTTMMGAGLYLILMALAGFYIREFGGNWGGVAQIVFVFLAALLLLVLFTSGAIRAKVKFFINKHFFRYHYDYREEWLKLSRNIAERHTFNELTGFAIQTMMDIVDSAGGGLWLKNDQGDYYLSESKNLAFSEPNIIARDDVLVQFFLEKKWVIDFVEYEQSPELLDYLDLSAWQQESKKVWVMVPIFQQNSLEAIAVLTHPKVFRALNWEDRDLLKTVGMQISNALVLSKTNEALAQAKQFEAYNQISAYLVHDLKNLVAQVGLIVKNSEKHKYNQEFIDDSIDTLKNVVHKIDHILGQLKKGNVGVEHQEIICLADVLGDVVVQQATNAPKPEVVINGQQLTVVGEKQKFIAILGHLVQNAQEATNDNGFVRLELSQSGQNAVIKIIDNGVGMDTKFIAERLFKPFDTTKGNAGMGIGVYEANGYILKQGGSCHVESQLGVGTCFTITLPLASEHL